LEELEMAGPAAGEVLVKIVATGVCHTDLKSAELGSRVPRPVVLGHEGAGIVQAVGAGVTKVAAGDHVVMTFGSCGHCPSCRAAQPAYCHTQNSFACVRPDGSSYLRAGTEPVHGDFFSQSSFATFAIGTERSVVKVRKDVPLELLGPLGCGIQTGAGAILNDLRLAPGQSLAIFGVGALGLSAVMAARLAGAGRIVAIDRFAHRLAMAVEFGASDVIAASDEPVAGKIRALVPAGVDLALDTTGVPRVMSQAVEVLAPLGTCCFVTGPWDGTALPVNVLALLKGRKIRGTAQGGSNPDLFIPQLIEFYRDGRFPFDRLVKFYPFAEIEHAFHDSERGATVKPVLRMATGA
jgi:aryl-alcohol dehydrogenase